jgi:phosphoribosylanthranilate isomerase
MSLLVKICGINSRIAAEATVRCGADFGGLVFYPRSPRNLSLAEGRELAGILRGHLRIVALVADASDDFIGEVVSALRPDFVQLHGSEDADRVGEVRAKFKVHVIKAVPIAGADDFAKVPDLMQASDMLLFDAKAPPHAVHPGGNSAAFDWKLMRAQNISRPWILAGGLTAKNVGRAATESGARYVDVSSGVESTPGNKDPNLIADFITAARKLTI